MVFHLRNSNHKTSLFLACSGGVIYGLPFSCACLRYFQRITTGLCADALSRIIVAAWGRHSNNNQFSFQIILYSVVSEMQTSKSTGFGPNTFLQECTNFVCELFLVRISSMWALCASLGGFVNFRRSTPQPWQVAKICAYMHAHEHTEYRLQSFDFFSPERIFFCLQFRESASCGWRPCGEQRPSSLWFLALFKELSSNCIPSLCLVLSLLLKQNVYGRVAYKAHSL